MLPISISIALGLTFLLVGALNVWLVLEAWSRVKAARASARMLALHRIGGYVFIALFCVMGWFMIGRLRAGGGASPTVTLHLALAMILSPLLFLKVLIARYYKNQHGLLMPLGLAIFVLAFVLIVSTTAPYLARPAAEDPAPTDVKIAADLTQQRCAKCHNLDRVVGARKDAQGWLTTVNRMRKLPGSAISESDAQTIVYYLSTQNRPQGDANAAEAAVARALVDQRCARCHNLDRVYRATQSPAEWREIVTRMVGYASGSAGAISPGEERQIADFLAATQTPEAVARRQQLAAASTSERAAAPAPTMLRPPSRASDLGKTSIGFVSLVCLAAVGLVLRRPGARPIAPPPAPAAVAPRPSSGPLLLELVRIDPQTADSKTLRFAVRGERKLEALPGQFLTFTFLFGGEKRTRCYSICSSPARTGYVEITPKRVPNGCVSVFLNDRAFVGMTVEATGPFGKFCLNPTEDRSIVLIAAGSGITPMMSMLRYIDDLCLDIHATLLYSVRTENDVIFEKEIEELQGRLKNFRCHLLVSQTRGHISHEFVRQAVADMRGHVFFLCGPPPFMDSVRTILMDLGAEPAQIRQESFGGAKALVPASDPAATGYTLHFAASGKTAPVIQGQSLLESASAAGVQIPSACRQGQCGTCRTRLIEGSVRMTTEAGLDPESKARGLVLTCVGHAEGNVTLDA